jgi:hypothetical protein
VGNQGYEFASNSVATSDDGSFELIVSRLDPPRRVRHVDSATIAIKGYLDDRDPSPHQEEDLRAWIWVDLAPRGERVEATEGQFEFTPVTGKVPEAALGVAHE